jgi:hypothetical protein
VIEPAELRTRFRAICGLITDLRVSDAEVEAAIAAFEALEAADEEQKQRCLRAISLTMEARSPNHRPGIDDEEEEPMPLTSVSDPVKKRVIYAGLPIAVEHEAGSLRPWSAPDGSSGHTQMTRDYGYIEGFLSGDGKELDVYLGPNEQADFVYVVHQLKAPEFERHDEDKTMLGFPSPEAAKASYLMHRKEEEAFGGMSVIPIERFKAKLKRRRPQSTKMIRASVSEVGTVARALMSLATAVRNKRTKVVAGARRQERYADRLVERATARAAKALAPDLAAIRAEVERGQSFEEIEQRLVKKFSGMDPAGLASVMRRAAIMAKLAGRDQAVKEI